MNYLCTDCVSWRKVKRFIMCERDFTINKAIYQDSEFIELGLDLCNVVMHEKIENCFQYQFKHLLNSLF